MWHLMEIAHFESHSPPDVGYLSCTECEAQSLLASFYFDPRSNEWDIRHWSKEDGDSLLIGSDHQYGDDGIYDDECLHAVRNLNGDGLEEVAVRCRERIEANDPKGHSRVTKDETLFYTLKNGAFSRGVNGRS